MMSLVLTTCHVYYSADDPEKSFSIEVPRVPIKGEAVERGGFGFYEVLNVKWVQMGAGGNALARPRWIPCLIARRMTELLDEEQREKETDDQTAETA